MHTNTTNAEENGNERHPELHPSIGTAAAEPGNAERAPDGHADPVQRDGELAERVTVTALAEQHGVTREAIFSACSRLKIVPRILRLKAAKNRRGATLTPAEARSISTYLTHPRPAYLRRHISPKEERGYFYIVQLEPQHDPARIKFGFTINVRERLLTHQCTSPFATCLAYWPCSRAWERPAINLLSAHCEPIRNEVFRAHDLEKVLAHARAFFQLLPGSEKMPPRAALMEGKSRVAP